MKKQGQTRIRMKEEPVGLRCSTRTVQHLCLELTYRISLLQKATDSCSEWSDTLAVYCVAISKLSGDKKQILSASYLNDRADTRGS